MDEEGVGYVGVAHSARVANDARHALRLAEKIQDLINEVGSQVVGRARTRKILLLPHLGCRCLALKAVKVALELGELAESTLADELLDGEEVGVPSTVLVDGEDKVLGLGEGGKLVGLRRGGSERLLADDVLASLQRGLFDVREESAV